MSQAQWRAWWPFKQSAPLAGAHASELHSHEEEQKANPTASSATVVRLAASPSVNDEKVDGVWLESKGGSATHYTVELINRSGRSVTVRVAPLSGGRSMAEAVEMKGVDDYDITILPAETMPVGGSGELRLKTAELCCKAEKVIQSNDRWLIKAIGDKDIANGDADGL